jgi:hypothetical protein
LRFLGDFFDGAFFAAGFATFLTGVFVEVFEAGAGFLLVQVST